jgi:methylase of polypeptide subunit release factors
LPDGKVFLEINENFGRELVSFFESAAFKNVQLLPDLNGKSRFISAEK